MRRLAGLACLLLAAVETQARAAGPEPAPPGPAALTGTVVSAETGRALAGAMVEVFPYRDAERVRERRAAGEILPDPIASSTAGGDGAFRVALGEPGWVMVVAQAPGHARSRLPRPVFAGGGKGRDLGRLELPPGTRTSGVVLDPDGKPLAGATVVALVPGLPERRRGGGGGFARLARAGRMVPAPGRAVTGADGTFVLESVALRPHDLRVHASGHAPALLERVRPGSGAARTILTLARGRTVTGKVVAPDGKTPVAGAWVLAGEEGWDGLARSTGDGSFRLERLRPGVLELTAVPSAAPAAAGGAFAASAPSRVAAPGPSPASPLSLKLRPGGTVRARAVDSETRRPVIEAFIVLEASGDAEPRWAVAGAGGEATFSGVPAGTVELRAHAEGYLEERLDPRPLSPGQTTALTAALRAAASLEGTVRDATGRPVGGAEVSIAGPGELRLALPVPLYFPIGVEPVKTDAEGRFQLEGLPPRQDLKVSVAAPGFSPWEMAEMTLDPGERRAGFEVLLASGATITGRLLDPSGSPVAGASVTASRRREGPLGSMVIQIAGPGGRGPGGRRGPANPLGEETMPEVLTGEDGVFRVAGARAGVWSLEVRGASFAPRTVAGIKVEDRAGADVGDVRLEPGARVSGRVLSPSGEAVAYARGVLRRELAPVAEFTTGADGSFSVEDLAAGEMLGLVIDADAFAAYEKGGLQPPAEDLLITLVPASTVRGQVIDRRTRRPVPDFEIALSRSRSAGGGAMMTRMAMVYGPGLPFHSEEGLFEVPDADPGKASIRASAPGYRGAATEIEIPEGKDLDGLVFELEGAGFVSGTVTDERGRPLAGVSVERRRATGPGLRMLAGGEDGTTTDGEGAFFLGGLERGPATLSFTHPDHEPAERDVDVSSDVEGLRVTLGRGASLAGIVLLEEDGGAVAGASVTATPAGGDRVAGGRSEKSAADGSFEMDGIAPGRYILRAEAPGLRAATEDVLVAPGASPPPVELRLGGGVTLSGSVTGVKEADLPRFTVRALTAGGGGFGVSAPVDATGRFEMKGLAPGTLTLLASSGPPGGRSLTRTVEIPPGVATFETVLELPRGHTVEGTVTRGERPVEGATVMARNAATRADASATADASGRYTLEDLEPGDYDVTVLHLASGTTYTTKLDLKADRTFDIALPLLRLTGLVREAGSDRPLEGASVTWERQGAAPQTGGFMLRRSTRSDASGRFAIEGLDDGTYALTASRDGYAYSTRQILINALVEPEPVTFELSPTDAFAFRVVDTMSGQPIRSLSALVQAGGGDPLAPGGYGAVTVVQGSLRADASGIFRLDTLRPGTYRIVLGGQGLATETLIDVTVPGPERTIVMGPGGAVEARAEGLRAGETARAVLLDPQGRPVYVSTMTTDPAFLLRADTHAVIENVKPGSYLLRASLPSGGLSEKPVTVAAGARAEVTIP